MPPVPHDAGVLWGMERSKRLPDGEMLDLFAKIIQRGFTLGNSVIGPCEAVVRGQYDDAFSCFMFFERIPALGKDAQGIHGHYLSPAKT